MPAKMVVQPCTELDGEKNTPYVGHHPHNCPHKAKDDGRAGQGRLRQAQGQQEGGQGATWGRRGTAGEGAENSYLQGLHHCDCCSMP